MGIHSRRTFLMSGLVAAGNLPEWRTNQQELDDYIEAQRRALQIPGLAACILKGGRVVWSKGYGWADIAKRIPMDPDRTIQNIGSISKTFAATAVMQLWEKGKFPLDEDVSEKLPFPVRNPAHPDIPITYRLLLTHRSGIADGPAYSASYASGDPKISLEVWLKEYFTDGGQFHNAANFHPWKPGEKQAYSNLGFGLLGYLVERISGEAFSAYTKKNIFAPLGMRRTGWFLSEIDTATHAVPYAPGADTKGAVEEREVYRKMGLLGGNIVKDPVSGAHQPLSLYSFPNFPDGAMRTSVNELARLPLAYINNGSLGRTRLLAPDTVRLMLTPQTANPPGRGLCWEHEEREGQRYWGHNGADPGVRTLLSFRPSDGIGVIVFINRDGVNLSPLNARLFQEAARL